MWTSLTTDSFFASDISSNWFWPWLMQWSSEIKVTKPYSNLLHYNMLVQSLPDSLCIIMWSSIKLRDGTAIISLGYKIFSISKKIVDVTVNSRMKQVIKWRHCVTVVRQPLSFAELLWKLQNWQIRSIWNKMYSIFW